jgi:Zn-dependent protease
MILNASIIELVAALFALLLAITIHEFSHALSARLLGDTTAERMGRLSLNPLVHLDPWGTIMMIFTVLTGFGIGWGKPTPVSPWNLKFGRRIGMAVVSVAGPLSNFMLALLLAPLLRIVSGTQSTAGIFLYTFIIINVGLAAFNLLPIPILDGYHILIGLISAIPGRLASQIVYQMERLEAFGPQILLVLILLGSLTRFNILMYALVPIRQALYSVIFLIWRL